MKNFLRSKWFVLIMSFIFLIVFGRVNKISSIADTAIIIGLGIDVQDNGYNISVQTFIPQGDNAGGSVSPTYNVYSMSAQTVSGALASISERIGLVLTLSHCHVIIASRKALETNLSKEIQNLIDAWHLTLQSILVGTEHNPEDVLKAKVTSANASSAYLQSVLRQSSSFDNLTCLCVKDLFVENYSRAKVSAVALLEMEELPPGTESTGGSSSESGGSDTDSKYYSFDLTKNLIFGQDVPESFIIEEPYAEMVNAFHFSKKGGRIEFPLLDGSTVHYQSIKVKGTMSYSKNKVDAKVEAQFVLREYKKKGEETALYLLTEEDRQEIINKTEEVLALLIKDTFFLSQNHNVDFFQIEDGMYRKFGRHWEKPDDFLQNLEFTATAKVSLKRG